MNAMQRQVLEFHRKFGHPVGAKPGFGRPNLRSGLIIEEAVETSVGTVGTAETLRLLVDEVRKLQDSAPKAPDFVEAVDGICDLLYVTFGAAIEFGLDIEKVFDEVHRSNMAKVGGATRADGKTLKPPGWVAPRIAEKIAEQA
jgi:predicted HAD superfamily Cof-like phosphohydrolase